MVIQSKVITRREFVRTTAQASFALALGLPLNAQQQRKDTKKATVVLIRHPGAVDSGNKINASIVTQMFDEAVAHLFNTSDAREAWKQTVSHRDVVGIKSNVWGPLPTPGALENAIIQRLLQTGVEEKNLSADDRGVLENPVFLRSTALINIRPMRTHHWAGVGSCLKNYIMFDPRPSKYHPDSCASLGALWQLPIVKNKTRLNVLVMLTPLFHGIGPHHWDIKYTWPYRGILVSTDPVAVDTTGLRIIEAYRRKYFGEYKPLWPPAKHISIADVKYNVGISDLKSIEIVKLGWDEEILIDS
jgi:hypothetical protein